MALYRYEALNGAGKLVRGTTEAGTPAEARAALRTLGLHATNLEHAIAALISGKGKGEGREERESRSTARDLWRGISGRRLEHLTSFSRHLGMLLKSGLPLAQALAILSEQVEDSGFREVLKDLAVRVREGAALDEALAVHPGFFPDLYICMAR